MKNTKLLVTSLTVALGLGAFIGANVNKVSKADAASPHGDSGKISIYFAGLASFDKITSVQIKVGSDSFSAATATTTAVDQAIGQYKYQYTINSNQTTLNAYIENYDNRNQWFHPSSGVQDWNTDYSTINLGSVAALVPGHSYVITYTSWDYSWDNFDHAWFNYTFAEYLDDDPPSSEKNTFYVHDPDNRLGNTLDNINVYGYGQAAGTQGMAWPGIHSGVTSTTLGKVSTRMYQVQLSVSYPNFIMNCGEGNNQTENVEDFTDHIGDVLVIGGAKEGYAKTYTYYWRETSYYTDYPANDGIYMCGSEIGWSFAEAETMTFNPDYSALDTDGNIAVMFGYDAIKDEEVQVRTYMDDVAEWHSAAGDYSAPNDFGHIVTSGDGSGNFHFDKAGKYDFFYKNNVFYVAVAKERYTVTVTNKLFDGATCTGSEAGTNQMATEGQTFTPENPSKENYVFRGFYTDANCTTEFKSAVLDDDLDLYAKFTRICYYLFGDDTYAGGTGKGWNVDYSSPVSAGTGNNELEGAVIIPEGASSVNPVKVKPLLYDGELQPRFYALGAEREYVTIDGEGNFSFTAKGTYAFYVSNDKDGSGNSYVYFEANAQSFYTKFKTEMDDVCDEAAGNTNLASLKAAWGRVKEFYLACSDSAKAEVYAIGFDGGDPKGDDGERFVASYYYIVNKYGTNNVEDFIWNNEIIRSAPSTTTISSSSPDFVNYAIIVASGVLILVEVSFLLLKRRKKNI